MAQIRPSSLPALRECPCFEPGHSDYADEGTDRHAALAAHFRDKNDDLLELLPDDDAEGVRWAIEQIELIASLQQHAPVIEQRMSMLDHNLNEIAGTPDLVCGDDFFDLKWRQRDYDSQLAAYALMIFESRPESNTLKAHILFAATKRRETYTITREAALAIITPIIDRANAPDKQPNPCSYCGWCSNKLTCPAFAERVEAIRKGREDWHLDQYHSTLITDPCEMSKALSLARQVKKWCEAVEHSALQMWLKEGLQIPGYALKSKAGKPQFSSITRAFELAGLPQETFLLCCALRMNTAKGNASQVGLIDAYTKLHGVTKAAAKREINKRLAEIISRKSSDYLKADNSTEEEEANA